MADIITKTITGKNSDQIKKDDKAKDISLNLTTVIFLSIIIFGVLYVMMNPQKFEKPFYEKYQECVEKNRRERSKQMYGGHPYLSECNQYK
ncbi:hypothetical protein LC593_05045 [Nostoc sp. CHAB 5844]|nr:hypothetical protein [Nostoc sp. CHAB 5844]